MTAFSDVTARIPHRAPWLLLDSVLATEPTRVTSQRRLSVGDPLLSDGLAETLMVEALAQTAACLVGKERGTHQGYLVALQGFRFHRRGQAGETLDCEAERTAVLGNLHRFTGRILSDGEVLCEGQMTFAIVPDEARP